MPDRSGRVVDSAVHWLVSRCLQLRSLNSFAPGMSGIGQGSPLAFQLLGTA